MKKPAIAAKVREPEKSARSKDTRQQPAPKASAATSAKEGFGFGVKLFRAILGAPREAAKTPPPPAKKPAKSATPTVKEAPKPVSKTAAPAPKGAAKAPGKDVPAAK